MMCSAIVRAVRPAWESGLLASGREGAFDEEEKLARCAVGIGVSQPHELVVE
jgi:hypothetical protein